MSTMVCSKCGTSLPVGAKACPSCGQVMGAASSPASPAPGSAGAKRLPMTALLVVVGGLVVLLGAVTLYRSGVLSSTGGTPAPATATPAEQPAPMADAAAPATPAPAVPGTPTPGASVPATPAAPPAPGTVVPAGTPQKTAPATAQPAAKPEPPPPPFIKTYECREYAAFNIKPDTAIITVDGEVIGIADEWSDGVRRERYKFKSDGVHYVKLEHRNYKTIWLKFVVSATAEHKTAEVELEMREK